MKFIKFVNRIISQRQLQAHKHTRADQYSENRNRKRNYFYLLNDRCCNKIIAQIEQYPSEMGFLKRHQYLQAHVFM